MWTSFSKSQFKMESLFLPIAEIVKGSQHGIQKTRQVLFRKNGSHTPGARTLFIGNLQQVRVRPR